MSLIRIRGRTILGPILSEEDRAQARVLRDRAVQTQQELGHSPRPQQQHQQTQYSSISSNRSPLRSQHEPSTTQRPTHTQRYPALNRNRRSGGNSSSSGLEDSPGGAYRVSLQPDDSSTTTTTTTTTTSTDLQPYMDGVDRMDSSCGSNSSASCDSWQRASSLIEMDRALLMSSSPEIATDIILGRLHPSSILPRPATTSPAPHSPAPAPTRTSESQDAATSTSLSLSFPSMSEGEEGAGSEGLEATEEILEESEEGGGSLPSEVESASDSHVDDAPQSVSRRAGRGGAWEPPQRDSGRSSSHSDYLDDYLEQLTRRCSSGLLGLEASTAALRSAPPAPPQTCPAQDPTLRPAREEQRSASAASDRRGEKRGGAGRTRRWSAGQPLDPSRSVGSKCPADLDDLSYASSSPPSPSSFSSHQEYLDSYLGHLTDDAWLQFPSRLSSRRLIYLSSHDYLASVRKANSSPSSSSTSCPSNGHDPSAREGAQKSDGNLEAPRRTPVSPRSPRDEPTEVPRIPDAPETPPDKAKVSSDEGIEVMGSPATPRSPAEKPQCPDVPEIAPDVQESGVAPQFVVGGPVGGRGGGGVGDETIDSSSDDSSETEPSTIVYVDECVGADVVRAPAPDAPHTSPRRDPTPHTSPRRDAAPRSPHKDSITRRDSQTLSPQKDPPHSPYKDPGLLKQSPRRMASPQRDSMVAKGASPSRSPRHRVTSPQEVTNASYHRLHHFEGLRKTQLQSQEEEDEDDEEEECLVVQVYGGRSPSPPSEAGEEVVKIVPQRREQGSAGRPVDQVLALLKVRQQQEVEALKRRQQQEVEQCLQQLRGVPPDQLATLLTPAPPLEAPQQVKMGGQVTLVANATFSLEGGPGGVAPPGLLPLLLGREVGSDTNNNSCAVLSNYTTTNSDNNNMTPKATTTTAAAATTSTSPPSPPSPPAIFPPTMEYYRLCTPEDEDDKFEADLPPQDAPTVTIQPGLFRVLGAGGDAWSSPRPTTITSLLATHPEAFADEAGGAGGAGVRGEAGLDMVPQRESEAAGPRIHPLAKNRVFLRGLVRLQACVRRHLTHRLLHTRVVQEQVATLAEIAKLARQFHRDIVADNLHRGDVQLHKALYKQEGLARERIWRVFIGLSVSEQMSLIRHDRKLSQAGEQRPAPATPPTHHPQPPSSSSKPPGSKRPSPSPPSRPQDSRARIITPLKGRSSPHLTHAQPTHIPHVHQSPPHLHGPSYAHTQSPARTHHHHHTHTYHTYEGNAHPTHQTIYAHQPIHTPQAAHHTHTHTKQHAHTLSHQPLHSPSDANKLSPRTSRLPLHLDRRAAKVTPQSPRSPQGVGRCASHPRTAPPASQAGRGQRTTTRIPGQASVAGRTLSCTSRTSSLASPRREEEQRTSRDSWMWQAPPPRPPTTARPGAGGRRPWR